MTYYKNYSQEADSALANAKVKLEDRRQKIRQLKETMGIALTKSEKEDRSPSRAHRSKDASSGTR